jgi:hypothetical protein
MPFKKRFKEIISTLGQKKPTLNATYGKKNPEKLKLIYHGIFSIDFTMIAFLQSQAEQSHSHSS